MDIKIAKYLLHSFFASSNALCELIPFIKEHCTEEEYTSFGKKVASISADISLELINPIFKQFPELEKSASDSIEKYNRYIL